MAGTLANGRAPGAPKFCEDCGTSLPGGRFCPSCGRPVHAESAAEADTLVLGPEAAVAPAPRPAPPAAPPPAAPPPRADAPAGADAAAPRRRYLALGLTAGAVAVVAVVAVVLLVGRGDGSANSGAAAYGQRLATAFAPVRSANRRLSSQIERLRGTRAVDARAALRDARQATSLAQGATTALDVPTGSAPTAARAAQVLDRESAYLSAVAAVLNDPSSPGVSELQSLESNLTSAISNADATIAGTSQDVSGADRLTSWAVRTARATRRHAAARRRAAAAAGRSNSRPTSAAAAPAADFTACDQNISAKRATTSCAFAENVFWEYWYFTSSGQGTRFTAYSPSTHIVYAVSCGGGSPVVCTTDSGAEVRFPIGAVAAYTQSQADAYSASRDLGPDPTALTGGA